MVEIEIDVRVFPTLPTAVHFYSFTSRTLLPQSRPTRPPFMSERHRSSSEPNVSPSSSRSHSYLKHKLHRKPAPPPPRPIFPPPTQQDVPVYAPPSNVRPERESERGRDEEKGKSREELERQERVLLQRAIEESKRDSVGSQRVRQSPRYIARP